MVIFRGVFVATVAEGAVGGQGGDFVEFRCAFVASAGEVCFLDVGLEFGEGFRRRG